MKNLISCLIAGVALAFTTASFAKNINLYDEPKDGAKVVGTIDASAGMVTIFTPKDNKAWMKVGNPTNGDVGWVKMSDIGPGFSVSQSVVGSSDSKDDAKNVHVLQIGSQIMTDKEIQDTMKQLQIRQQQMQMSIQKMVDDMSNDIKKLNAQVPAGSFHFPVVMPVILYSQPPAPNKAADKKSDAQATPAKTPATSSKSTQ